MTVFYNNCLVVFADISSILKEAPEKYELYHLLLDIKEKWYDIGLSLLVCRSVLDNLKHNQDDDLTKVLKVLNYWKDTQSSPFTWETVITAMESPNLHNIAKADEIRQHLKLCKLLHVLLNVEIDLLILSLSINCIVQTF